MPDLFIKKLREHPAARLQSERFGGIKIVVIRERRFFVEGLHGVGNIGLIGGPVVLQKELRDPAVHGKGVAAIFAGHLARQRGKSSAANGAGQGDFKRGTCFCIHLSRIVAQPRGETHILRFEHDMSVAQRAPGC
jgi:hypothetical protein